MAGFPAGHGSSSPALKSDDLELCGVTSGIIQLQPKPTTPRDAYSQAEGY